MNLSKPPMQCRTLRGGDPSSGSWRRQLTVLSLIAAAIAASQELMGRVWWCRAGDLRPWSFDIWSQHNSQHLLDPYSLSHLQHGLGLYLLVSLLAGRLLTPFTRTVLVALVEAAWEIVENTDWMIQRYREVTIALDYYGDSIMNSLADYGFCLVGIAIVQRIPAWAAATLFVGLEIISVMWIRDSLMLNVLMLLWPIDAIRQWQMGGL